MKTYHGERTEDGCVVTVDGRPLRMRSDLSGNASTAFDWGYIGGGQLSLALLSDFFGSDRKAIAMSDAFEQQVIAVLPVDSWTLTGRALATALEPLVGIDGARADDVETARDAVQTFAGMPGSDAGLVRTLKAEDAAGAGSMVSEGGPLAGGMATRPPGV
jgi:hypothetical protein